MGGLLDVQPITDVINVIDNGEKFQRPVYAGNAIATVSTSDSIKLLTIRATNFEKIEQSDASHEHQTEEVQVDMGDLKGKWIQNMASVSESADLSSSKFVVSGGRGLKNGENFSLLYNFAEALGQ